ncbi:hypothetical protein FZ989_07435 [Clostridium perfringens]|nr:hypothetical protein [Clostridium perfringens]
MPIDLIDTNDIDEISKKFGVSYSAAKLRVKKTCISAYLFKYINFC